MPDLGRVLAAILSGITNPQGLNFDRAFLFLADESDRELRPYSAVGSPGEGPGDRKLSDRLAGFAVPLSASAPTIDEGDENVPMQALLARCAGLREPFLSNTIQTLYQPPPASGVEVLRLTHVAAVPLVVKDSVLGVIVADNTHSGREIQPDEMKGLETLGNLAYETRLDQEIEVAARAQRALALIVFHVRRFKQVNLTHGRQCGNQALKDLAVFLKTRVRAEDLIARYGQAEFVVMLTGGATREEALTVAEKLRAQAIEQELGGLPAGEIQICGGLAWLPHNRLDSERLSQMLDDALERAQKANENRMVFTQDQ
jgi:diguanylate cyclase (GGDEF)-like protein